MGESRSKDIADKLVKIVDDTFYGLEFDTWHITAQSDITRHHPKVVYIIGGQLCPEQSKNRPRRRTPTRMSLVIKIARRRGGIMSGEEWTRKPRRRAAMVWSPETVYCILKHLEGMLPRCPGVFDDEYRQFFTRLVGWDYCRRLRWRYIYMAMTTITTNMVIIDNDNDNLYWYRQR